MVLRRGDRFVETFYDEPMYNIFQIFDRDRRQAEGLVLQREPPRGAYRRRRSPGWIWPWIYGSGLTDGRLVLDRE